MSIRNDFDALLQEVLSQASALHIPVSPALCPHISINRRATTRFGCCVQQGGGFVIELSHRLLTAECSACCQILAHEILHTCPDCRNHGAVWKHYAAQMNAAYGYRIARTATCEALGIQAEKPVRHLLVCDQCGLEFKRSKASRLVTQPQRYRCKCGGKLIVKY